MKTLLLMILLFGGAETRADDARGILATGALRVSLIERCSGFLKVNPDQKWRLLSICASLAGEMVSALDVSREEATRGLVFATSEMRSVLSDPRTPVFLRSLRDELAAEATQPSRTAIPLYERVLSTYGGDEAASRVMLTLFQDNSFYPDRPGPPLHWNYLKAKQGEWIDGGTLEDLRIVLRLLRTSDPKSLLPRVRAYPAGLEEELSHFNDKFYYFYLPRYLTTKLAAKAKAMEAERKGDAPILRRVVRSLPTLMSLIYKHSRGRNSYWKAFLFPLKATAEYDEKGELVVEAGWEYRYRDLYMAYIGTLDALNERDGIGFEKFRKMIATRPGEAIHLISK